MSGVSADRSPLPGIDAVSRYDIVLGLIPLAFVAASFAGELLSVDTQVRLAVASVVSLLGVVDALLFNPPRGPGSGRSPT